MWYTYGCTTSEEQLLRIALRSVVVVVGMECKLVVLLKCFNVKVGCYDMYLRYWRALTPQFITFDPEGVRAYVLHKNCQETPVLAENPQELHVCTLT